MTSTILPLTPARPHCPDPFRRSPGPEARRDCLLPKLVESADPSRYEWLLPGPEAERPSGRRPPCQKAPPDTRAGTIRMPPPPPEAQCATRHAEHPDTICALNPRPFRMTRPPDRARGTPKQRRVLIGCDRKPAPRRSSSSALSAGRAVTLRSACRTAVIWSPPCPRRA